MRNVYPASPGAPLGGTATTVALAPVLDDPAASTRLEGTNAYAFTDAPDGAGMNTTPAPGSDVRPSCGTDFDYSLTVSRSRAAGAPATVLRSSCAAP